MHLKELLQLPDVQIRNVELKRAFNAISEAVCIDGLEVQAIHILANLTLKLSDALDVTSATEAYSLLKSQDWLSKCLSTVGFRHSHNLKYPDYKNRGVLRLEPIGRLPVGYISSPWCKDHARLGWSHNSADINYQLFLCASFNWQGGLSCIAELIRDGDSNFKELLFEAGIYKKDVIWLTKELQGIVPRQTLLELGPELRQIRLPYRNAYCAVTPVPSHMLQREIHLALKAEKRHRGVIKHARAASVGDLAAATAGRVFTFRSVPKKLWIWHSLNPKQSLPDTGLLALEQLTKAEQMLLTDNNRKRLVDEWKQDVLNYIDIWIKKYDIPKELTTSTLVEQFNVHLSKTKIGRELAYQPDVTRLLNQLISKASSDYEVSPTTQGNHQYLVLPGIKISGATAFSSAYTVGIPSLMGIWGFLHAFERNIQRRTNRRTFQIESFALCLHQFALDDRGLTKEVKLDGKRLVTPAIMPTRYCDFVVSFVLKVPKAQLQLEPNQWISCLPNSLCQGAVHAQIGRLESFLWMDSFYRAVQAIPEKRGRWLAPDLNFSPSDVKTLTLEPELLLTTVGYQLLETPTEKTGAVDDMPHAFAEPVLGNVYQRHAGADALDHEFFWKLTLLPNAFLLGTEGTEHEAASTI